MSAANDKALRMAYRIGRGEQGVLTFEPYKSTLLPLWRFKTPEIARRSSQELWERFEKYDREGDFVGMDMTRKFIQMGMTRAKRYANHKAGVKYDKETGELLERSTEHEGAKEKLEASNIFREMWLKCREHSGYQRKKEAFMAEQKEWDKQQKANNKATTKQTVVDRPDPGMHHSVEEKSRNDQPTRSKRVGRRQ